MKANKIIVISSIGLGVLFGLASLAVQPPASWASSLYAFHFSLSTNFLTFLLHLGAAALFIMSLSVYKEKLRRAFISIVLGVVLLAVGTLQLPILDTLDAWNSPYVANGIVGLPFLISGLVIYFGASKFGKLIGIGGLSANKFVVIPSSIALTIAMLYLPHVETMVPEMNYDVGNFVLGWTTTLLIASAVVFLRASRKIGAHYKQATTWLGLALLGSTSCLIIALIDTHISTAVRDPLTEFLNILTIVAGLIWLKAGYAFTKTKEY